MLFSKQGCEKSVNMGRKTQLQQIALRLLGKPRLTVIIIDARPKTIITALALYNIGTLWFGFLN